MKLITFVLWILAALNLMLFGSFALVSLGEGERRAVMISGALALSGAGLFALSTCLPAVYQQGILLATIGGVALAVVVFCLPVGRVARLRDKPKLRYDERDIMFARARLVPGSQHYHQYYTMRPENEARDALFRVRPGLLAPNSRFANPLLFAAAQASFSLTEAMHAVVEGSPTSEKTLLPPNPELTCFVKALARYYGALEVGITTLEPYHVYSHIGRGPGVYGAQLEVEHRFAIAFSVEMDYGIMGFSPRAPATMESAHQYVEAGRVAVQLANVIRNWGYPARAHMDGNYRIICPLVARDAGLGEIGRMGLLMTPRQGPRVRLAVVTTDLDLVPGPVEPDASIVDFCTTCNKCAMNCPAGAIPYGERQEIDGALRWRIAADLCFRYWNTIGTDCGRCMTVCPYSHPDSLHHNLIRWGNAHSGLFRRAAVWLDDFFYGKKPTRHSAPFWMNNT